MVAEPQYQTLIDTLERKQLWNHRLHLFQQLIHLVQHLLHLIMRVSSVITGYAIGYEKRNQSGEAQKTGYAATSDL